MPTISVIVPVYNVERYLQRCIDSILAQTYIDFELLLINDGSKDRSYIICDEYALKDPRIRVFHKENGGVSSARNLGLDNARGEWITFVDADDYLFKDAFENLLKDPQADLIVGGFSHIGVFSGRERRFSPINRIIDIKVDVEFLTNMINFYLTTPWCKFFRNDIICAKKLKFNKYLLYGEDTDFVFQYVLQINSIQFISKQVYCYCDGENAFVKYVLGASHFKRLIDSTCLNFDLLAKKTGVSFIKIRNVFLRDYSSLYLNGLLNIRNYGDFMKEVKAYKLEKCICFADSFKYKAVVVMINNCPCLAYLCIRLYKQLVNGR